jgi:hypothetical protein
MPASQVKHKPAKLPHPKKARVAAGLKWRALAAAVPCSSGTISTCERTGQYPRQRAIRAAYLAALHLTETAKP